MDPIRGGIVPEIQLSDSCKYCNLVKDPKLDGIVPPRIRLEFIFKVTKSVRLPRLDGKEPLIELLLITRDVNDASRPIDEDSVPVSFLEPIFSCVTVEPLHVTPVHPQTDESGTPPVHFHPLRLVRRRALVPAATLHIEASFVDAVGNAVGIALGDTVGSDEGFTVGRADGGTVGKADGDDDGRAVGLRLGLLVGCPVG